MTLPSAPLYNKKTTGHLKLPHSYNPCPICATPKHKYAKMCRNCYDKMRNAVPTIEQPADPSYRFIPLTQGMYAIVDTGVYEWLIQWKWHAQWEPKTKSFYASRRAKLPNGKMGCVRMHRQILGLDYGDPQIVDHENHNTLDNRRFIDGKEQLRLATFAENSHNQGLRVTNTSGYKGVDFCKSMKMWRARINVNGESILIGYFSTAEVAYNAYCEAAKEHHGRFARLA